MPVSMFLLGSGRKLFGEAQCFACHRFDNEGGALAPDLTVVVLKGTGHWLLEERPKETTEALVKFL
jgi:mono/diheme cytochrome c family protein